MRLSTSSRPDRSSDAASETLALEGHDYIWARLPFLVPMAAKIGRTCCRTRSERDPLAPLVERLDTLARRHLDREERLLARSGSGGDGLSLETIARLTAEHRDLQRLLGRVCAAAGLPDAPADDACPTVRAFHRELRALDRHVRDQIRIEDEILASRFAGDSGDRARRDATKRGTP